jgi:biotin operon repressor
MEKVRKLLIENSHMKVAELQAKTRLSKASIYLMIKRLNEQGTGVYPTKKGYILAEYAEQCDDVHFLRKINGYHASACMRLHASIEHINKRWKSEHNQQLLMNMVRPLQTSKSALESSRRAIIQSVNQFGL